MSNKSELTIGQPAVAAHGAKPLLSGPKRQHFLPKFYLEGFANRDGMIAVFDRESKEIRVQQPVNTCVIGHFYTIVDEAGRRRFELEQLLSEYEGKASLVIKKLSSTEEINADERTDLAIFVALAAFRTPDIVDSLKAFNSDLVGDMCKRIFVDVEQVKAQMRSKRNAPSAEELEAEARELVEFAQSGQYEVATSHTWAVGVAMKMAFIIAPILAGRDWAVVHRDNERKSFVTTDAPVLLTTVAQRDNSFWGIGFGSTDALVLFPLTETCILLLYGSGGDLKHRTAGAEPMRHVNLALADRCQRFVIGRYYALVRSLTDRLCLASKKWQPKMQRS